MFKAKAIILFSSGSLKKRQKAKSLFICLGILFSSLTSWSTIRLPGLVANNMILQRNIAIPIWGWASPGQKIKVRFRDKNYESGPADASGKWTIKLKSSSEGGPYEMDIDGDNDHIHLQNILIGDVWLCGGQSNMVFDFNNARAKSLYATEIASSANDQIRQILIDRGTASFPAQNCRTSGWRSASPQSLASFTAVGYFFALNLYQKYHVPIGLINSTYGGTQAESWTSAEGLKELPSYSSDSNLLKDTATLKSKIQSIQDQIAVWNQTIDRDDKGLDKNGNPVWASSDLELSQWTTMSRPNFWDSYGYQNNAGTFWYRKEIEIPTTLEGKPATLYLGQIDDADVSYFNGQIIGRNTNRDIKRVYKIPAGLIKAGKNILLIRITNYGGTGGMFNSEDLKLVSEQNIEMNGKWHIRQGIKMDAKPANFDVKTLPSSLYNAMIAPLEPYALKGILWYQGEYNAPKAFAYRKLFPALIADWRAKWQQGDLPFIYAQLPNFQQYYDHPIESDWAELREAQSMALNLPHTAMAVTIDLGEANDIHPVNKKDVGYRLSLAAEKLVFGEKNMVASGPAYKSMKVEGNKIILTFTGSAPVAKGGGDLKFFAIAGEDKKFVWGTAVIIGNTIEVSSPSISNPIAVRYAWAGNPEGCNLYNSDGLPASPFRTDDWPGITVGK